MSEKLYTIKVGGESPMEVQVGTINKTTGQPDAGAVSAVTIIGEIAIPNFSVIWAKVERKGDRLTGKITPIKWEAEGGELTEIRYLRNCTSISKRYQEQEKFQVRDEDSEISLFYGLNEFDEKSNVNLSLMLKYHTYNGSNVSRDPTKKVVYYDYEPSKVMNYQASFIELRQNAENLVLDCRNNRKKLEALAVIFDLNKAQLDEIIFDQLMNYTQKPDWFWEIMNAEKDRFRNTLVKSRELELIDMALPNYIMLLKNGKKDILIEGVEGKEDKEKIDYVLGNMVEPNIFEGLHRLSAELQQYETKRLQ